MNKLLVGITMATGLVTYSLFKVHKGWYPICSPLMEDIFKKAGEEMTEKYPDGNYPQEEYSEAVRRITEEIKRKHDIPLIALLKDPNILLDKTKNQR